MKNEGDGRCYGVLCFVGLFALSQMREFKIQAQVPRSEL